MLRSFLLSMLAVSLLALLGCEPRVALGGVCTSQPECESPYLCRAGRCRVECVDDMACGAGRCVLVSPGIGGCAVIEDGDAGIGVDDDATMPLTDAGVRFPRPRLCRSASECGSDQICDDDFGPSVCRPICDSHDDCPASGVCDYYATETAGEYVHGCASLCLPGTDQGCPVETTCRMAFRSGMFLPEGPPSLTLCAPFDDAGREHCGCENLDSGHECGPGLSCEQPDEGRMCLRICEVGTECSPTTRCERTPRSVLIDGIEYGVCPPTVGGPIDC